MSGRTIRAYRFATAGQWARCITHRFDPSPDGGLLPALRLGAYAAHIPGTASSGGVPPAVVDRHGVPLWLTDPSGSMWNSPRVAADDDWAWAFASGGTVLSRFDRETLQPDLAIELGLPIRDIASDGRDGIWALAGDVLLHFDCEGRPRERHAVPCEAAGAVQIGSVLRGQRLVLLAADRKRLLFLDAEGGALQSVRSIGQWAPCWSATELAADTRNRIALWGLQTAPQKSWLLFVLDGSGDTVEGPVSGVFQEPAGAAPPRSLASSHLAIHRQTVWFATDAGLWRLDPGGAAGARESESSLLTRALVSLGSDSDRGWLRAEASIDLPDGAALEAQVATTDKPQLAQAAEDYAADPSLTSEQKQEAIWALFDPAETKSFTFTGSAGLGTPISIPILEPRDRWLWLRILVMTPPGATPAPLTELRVLYPNISIVENLPSAFRGERNDPTGELRTILGVLESTTQRFDERIRGIESYLDARTAPPEWLNYLARWLALPWDDELPESSKRQLLGSAGEILDRRGTRAGLMVLLRALAGPAATIGVVDVTVAYAPLRIGGHGRTGGSLPALMAGARMGTPTVGGKAVLGLARLCGSDDPLASIVPALQVRITVGREVQRSLGKLLRRILYQYIPAGMSLFIDWRLAGRDAPEEIGEFDLVLDGDGPGRLGRNSALGRTVVGGRGRSKLDEGGLDVGFKLP